MARNVLRTADIYDREILKGGGGLDDIKSMVVDSSKLTPETNGRTVLRPGEVMGKIAGDAKGRVMPIRLGTFGTGGAGAWAAADIVGINETLYEFPTGVTLGLATDHEVAILHQAGLRFIKNNLSGYVGNETIIATALPGCKFE